MTEVSDGHCCACASGDESWSILYVNADVPVAPKIAPVTVPATTRSTALLSAHAMLLTCCTAQKVPARVPNLRPPLHKQEALELACMQPGCATTLQQKVQHIGVAVATDAI